ncbi:MAG: hypothetical protein IPN06_13190 [Burkholderiales bacterium]|nr:hypothetical protein [Burkholderiales bacterium]
MRTPQELDNRSLALHRLVADKVRRDVALLDRAKEIVQRWHQTASPRTFVYLDAWQDLLEKGEAACLAAATEESEWANAMRQASPLACLLTHQERFAFLKQWRQSHAPQ